MPLSADKLNGDADFHFQQTLHLLIVSKLFSDCIADHGITVLDLPANSPNVNLILNPMGFRFWGLVRRY